MALSKQVFSTHPKSRPIVLSTLPLLEINAPRHEVLPLTPSLPPTPWRARAHLLSFPAFD